MDDRKMVIKEIWDLYRQVYEGGDDSLDRLINAQAYERWLGEAMSDEYLESRSGFELELIRGDLANALCDYA